MLPPPEYSADLVARRKCSIRAVVVWLLLVLPWLLFETTRKEGFFGTRPQFRVATIRTPLSQAPELQTDDGEKKKIPATPFAMKTETTSNPDPSTPLPSSNSFSSEQSGAGERDDKLNFRWSPGGDIMVNNRTHSIPVPYQCAGPVYNNFTAELRQFAAQQIHSGKKHPLWGQRGLPPNKWILFWGNSHTRQIGNSLVAQHTGEIVKLKRYDAHINKNMARRFDLTQNRTVFIIANSYVAYSHNWLGLLQKQMGKKLWKMSALIVGTFNTCNAPVHTTFEDEMEEIVGQFAGVDCDTIEGPTFEMIAKEYKGPMAYASMFATYRHKEINEAHDQVLQLQHAQEQIDPSQRRTFVYEDARQYIDEMGTECGSPIRNGKSLSDCENTPYAARKYHRCTGAHGGHPDLVAWDLIDFIWQSA